MTDDTVTVLGKKTKLITTTSRHYCISLLKESYQEEFEILAINLKEILDKDFPWLKYANFSFF